MEGAATLILIMLVLQGGVGIVAAIRFIFQNKTGRKRNRIDSFLMLVQGIFSALAILVVMGQVPTHTGVNSLLLNDLAMAMLIVSNAVAQFAMYLCGDAIFKMKSS
jgi:uncharacterized membrane-anchored protein